MPSSDTSTPPGNASAWRSSQSPPTSVSFWDASQVPSAAATLSAPYPSASASERHQIASTWLQSWSIPSSGTSNASGEKAGSRSSQSFGSGASPAIVSQRPSSASSVSVVPAPS